MKNKKKLGLTTLIFIALIAGAITGIIINYCIPSNKIVDDFIVSGLFYVVGQGFIKSPEATDKSFGILCNWL